MRNLPITLIGLAGLAVSIGVWGAHFRRVSHHAMVARSISSASTAELREVLAAGFDPDTRLDTPDNRGRHTPLVLAALEGNLEAMRVLLEHGANPMIVDRRGRPSVVVVAEANQEEALALLIDAAGGRETLGDRVFATALIEATALGHDGTAAMLLETGMDVNAVGRQGSRPLHAAVAPRSSLETFNRILDAGADVNVRTPAGDTALVLCLQTMRRNKRLNSYAPRVRRLLEAGADPNIASTSSRTPLELAQGVSNELAARLITSGADVNAKGRNGQFPLHHAIRSNSADLVRLLLEAGADPTQGCTANSWKPVPTLALAVERADGNDQDGDEILATIRDALGLPPDDVEGAGEPTPDTPTTTDASRRPEPRP